MDAITYIVAFMAAIVFGWVGYFLGNFFPVFGKAKKIKDANRAAGRSMVDLDPVKSTARKAMDWLMERSSDGEMTETDYPQASNGDLAGEAPTSAPSVPTAPPSVTYVVDHPEQVGDDALVVWHDRAKKKLIAKIANDFIDLDKSLDSKHHGALSILLIDLQEKVGLSSALRRAISDETDKVIAEKERQQMVPKKDEELQGPSFNPIKSFVNYVRADAPKLEDGPESIPNQINEILQRMIRNTHLENRGISVTEWPNRGVVFIVGVNIYEDIHKIPDSEIRLTIRNAVKRWEETQAKKDE